jgi:6-pyruvoyltetrahydropterin/6-carboxytetrahydropterin synthase
VRLSLNDLSYDTPPAPTNSFGGVPTHRGFGQYLRVQATLCGELEPQTSYLRNIKEIDAAVRSIVIGKLTSLRSSFRADQPLTDIAAAVFETLQPTWNEARVKLETVSVWLTPFLCVSYESENPMPARLSQKFEFSASHRLHNPAMADDENRRKYGKCNNPLGHGHNYELQVTLAGAPGASGLLIDVPAFEQIVAKHVVERFDHRNLNVEVPEFAQLVPTVENIAMVIYRLLKSPLSSAGSQLASVTVWETPKTWCEYSE